MKNIHNFLICLSILISLFSQSLFSQVSNDNRYNVFSQSTRYYFGPDDQDGTNYPTVLLHADMDTNGASTRLIENNGTPYEYAVIKNADTPEDWSYTQKILGHLNQSSSYMDFTFYMFDNFCGDRYVVNSCCGFGCFGKNDYETSKVVWSRRYLRNNEPGTWYNSSLASSDSQFRVYYRTTWRYYNGEWDRPLAFGNIGEGVLKNHTNYTRAAASGVDVASYYGYLNDWSSSYNSAFSDSRDVTYSFVLTEPRVITARTDFGVTDYDTKIHIVRDNQNGTWDVLHTNDDISAANTKSQILEKVLQPGLYNIVVEGKGSSSGKFYLRLFSHTVNLTSGSIAYSRPWIEPGCSITAPISSAVDATINFGDVDYVWQKSVAGANSWTTINGANNPSLTAAELGNLTVDTDIRRVASGIGKTEYSNVISLAVASSKVNGEISGTVTGPGGVNMSGVTIYAEIDSPHQGQCPGHIYETQTDGSGQYFLTDLYYGLNTASDTIPDVSFRVWAEFFTHDFNPVDHVVSLNTSLSVKSGYDFVDEEAIFISGHVMQSDPRSENQNTCGVPDVTFFLNDLFQTQTSQELGDYDLPVIAFGDNEVEPLYLNHTITPSSILLEDVFNDVAGVDFDDTTTHKISGSVRACNGFAFGAVELLFQDEANCFKFRDTTDNIGDFSIDLPSRKYTIQITDTDLDGSNLLSGYDHNAIAAYFAEDIHTADIDTSDVDVYFQYRQLPDVTIEGLTPNQCGDIVVEQGVPQLLKIYITEPNTNMCGVDTGLVKIVNAISGLQNEIVELPFKDGYVEYELVPGEPKITGDFKLGFTVTAFAVEKPELKTVNSFDAIVIGNNARESTFTTVSPEIPLMILRDPPGDGSYSFLEESQTSEMSIGFSALTGGSVNAWSKAKIGAAFSTEFFGVGIETSSWGELTGSTTVGAYNVSQTEAVMRFTNGTRYQTFSDGNPDVMGQGGDFYIGAALNIHYALTDVVDYNESTCMVEQSVEVIMGSDIKEQTQFRYTDYFIRTSVIPDIELLISLSSDPMEIEGYQRDIDMWYQTLQLNYDLKERAADIDTFPTDISWSGATESELFTETSSSYNSSYEFFVDMESEIAAEAGYEVAGSGASGGVSVKLRVELGAGISATNMIERRTGFYLSDSDPDDGFNTIVKMCPTYNTPVFENIAGFTSCPHEDGTLPIDFPYLEIDNPVQVGIDPNTAAGFNFQLTNLSQKQLTRSYYIDVVENSNPYGAVIDPGGAGFPLLISNIAYNQTVTRFFSIARNPSNTMDYSLEGIQFIAYPAECSDDQQEIVTSKATVSVYFDPPCSNIVLEEPNTEDDNWIHNVAAGNHLEVHIKDYTVGDLNNINIQYSPAGLNSWTDAETLLPGDLNSDPTVGTYVQWDIVNIDDDDYDIRVRLNCTGGTVYSARASGVIDRMAPVVFGIPEPVDDHYDPLLNDQISVSFEEDIDCGNASVIITDLETDDVYQTSTTCAGNTVIITPYLVLPESIFRVQLTGVEDVHQNERDVYEWVFITGDYVFDPDCSPVAISNNNLDQNAISQSTYSATQISSDGLVAQSTTIVFEAEESVDLNEGFEVAEGAIFIANIEECEE